jgi:hypothetical protein
VLRICAKYVIFKSFPSPFTSPFIALKQWLHGYYTTFKGPNVNEIISYFGHCKIRY